MLFGSFGTGLWVGYALKSKTLRPDVEDIGKFMAKLVNLEEVDERFNLTKKMLHDANRRTMPRFDAGAPARISTMRVRRRGSKRRPR